MNVTYLEFIRQEKITGNIVKEDIAKQLLLISMGTLSEKTNLSGEQLTKLYETWKRNFHPF